MEAVFTTRRERAAKQLRFVQFYLPRMRAAAAHDPAVWVFALALQQLGVQVLAAHAGQLSGPATLPEHQRHYEDLLGLGHILRARYQVVQGQPRREWETRMWSHVQQVLQLALSRAEALLQADAEEEKRVE